MVGENTVFYRFCFYGCEHPDGAHDQGTADEVEGASLVIDTEEQKGCMIGCKEHGTGDDDASSFHSVYLSAPVDFLQQAVQQADAGRSEQQGEMDI